MEKLLNSQNHDAIPSLYCREISLFKQKEKHEGTQKAAFKYAQIVRDVQFATNCYDTFAPNLQFSQRRLSDSHRLNEGNRTSPASSAQTL